MFLLLIILLDISAIILQTTCCYFMLRGYLRFFIYTFNETLSIFTTHMFEIQLVKVQPNIVWGLIQRISLRFLGDNLFLKINTLLT